MKCLIAHFVRLLEMSEMFEARRDEVRCRSVILIYKSYANLQICEWCDANMLMDALSAVALCEGGLMMRIEVWLGGWVALGSAVLASS